MPVTVVVGGQYGSEGKGKVAHALARDSGDRTVAVRVGGSNSGHTVVGEDGKPLVLRQLPTAAWLPGPALVLPPGSYLEPGLFLREMAATGAAPGRVRVDPDAAVIGPDDARRERDSGLRASIGSTESGTGSAVLRRIAATGRYVGPATSPSSRRTSATP
jgi:adenylosuccinate synthase